MQCLVITDTDLYSLTKGKSYLAKQKWRRSTCLRDQCYDVGCHPWYLLYLYTNTRLRCYVTVLSKVFLYTVTSPVERLLNKEHSVMIAI